MPEPVQKINEGLSQQLAHALEHELHFTEKEQSHRRGDFAFVAAGVSYGGGQKVRPILHRVPACLAESEE